VRSHQTKRKACNCNKNTGKNKSRGMTLYCNCKSNKGPLMGGIEGVFQREGVFAGCRSENRSMPIGVRSPSQTARLLRGNWAKSIKISQESPPPAPLSIKSDKQTNRRTLSKNKIKIMVVIKRHLWVLKVKYLHDIYFLMAKHQLESNFKTALNNYSR